MEDEYQFAELIAKQQNSYEKIKTLQTNYKKDSLSRKTLDYLNKRIEALQSHWDEFRVNHELLKKYESSKRDHDYFQQNIYDITKYMFEELMKCMTQLQNELLKEPGFSGSTKPKIRTDEAPLFDTTGVSQQPSDMDEASSLLRIQMCNFNALERAVSKIDLGDVSKKCLFQEHLNTLRARWEAIDKVHWQLNLLLQGSDEDYQTKFDHWEQVYDDLKEKLNHQIFETSHYYDKTTPRIELPEFNGDYNNWVSFRDLFYEIIHDNPTLNKTQKMKFLKSKLRDEAAQIVRHLSISKENYDCCLDILQRRYNNKRLLFTSYIETLLNQPFIDNPTSGNMKKMHDTTKECLDALKNIEIDIPAWGPLIVHLLASKLDDTTYNEYTQKMKNSRELPDLNEFMEFLESKFMKLETNRHKKGAQKQNYSTNNQVKQFNNYKSANYRNNDRIPKSYHATLRNCPLCKNDHVLRQCPTFLNMDVATRNKTTSTLNLCKNCLFCHGENKCNSTKRCRMCNFKHHSLLHDDTLKKQQPRPTSTVNYVNGEQEILLTTLQLRVKNKEGDYVILRALLDQGSQVTLITENAAQRLNLPRSKLNASVTGVGTIMGTSKGMIKLECKSIHSDYTFQTEALVMRKLINNLPNSKIDTRSWTHINNVKLADPDFNTPGPIDLLLGADIYSDVIMEGILKHKNNMPVAQQTQLGWILCGATKQLNCLVTLTELDNLSKFWEIEEVPTESELTSSDSYCEQHYAKTTERNTDGRYVVKMPMKPNYEHNLGNSKPQAIAQFLNLEKKMSRNKTYAQLYKHFMNDYTYLGHMKPVTETDSQVEAYLPHHGVLRESSTTTKLRVVFNASMKTDSGNSLNDLMEKGPNLQKDILALITKWRSYKYVLTADIEKMYRQILIHEDQQSLQKIIWRDTTTQRLKEMQLCTLTYGTKAAPFIAMRTLQQLAIDEGSVYPLAQKALRNDFYMDDVITGEHTIENTKNLQKELYELLNKGGFILRKWASNEPHILKELQDNEKSQNNYSFKNEELSKTLGLAWNNVTDNFQFTCEINKSNNEIYTKRRLLSEISKIFDPLGWLAPVTVQAKLIFQKLWSEDCTNIGWDDNVPENITKEWIKIKSDLIKINNITIPRWIKNENNLIELQAFCDASEKAYACVIYSRTTAPNSTYVTTLLAAKTKVAPLNKSTTIPRLELCAALLLAKLLEKLMEVLAEYNLQIFCWTDSKVVLAWLQGNQNKYEKYITNRIEKITNIVPAAKWGYVKSNDNPADCATRGLSPSKLLTFQLWWEGPLWLKEDQDQLSATPEIYTTNEELKTYCFTTEPVSNKNQLINSLLERHSNLDRIIRILAWVIRFVSNLRNKSKLNKNDELTLNEINSASCVIIKSIQNDYYENEIKSLQNKGKLPNKSTILKLYPFLDAEGILRVGGRLKNSNLPHETRHPMVIPSTGRLTQLIVEKSHQQTLHGGPRLTLAHTRNNYWIVSGNRTVKKILRQCVKCRRYTPSRTEQLMGNLPKERITPSRPFLHTGVDFTGHVDVKINKGRGIKTCKGYIAIFICMCTKAVHIELVSDLSTQTFIAALKRMSARRGTPKHIYSDNGTNFVGAAKLLYEEFQHYKTMCSPEFFKEINDLQIEWHFNAPSWPTAGGLWEAAVRSMKNHLKRVIGHQKLTYEQFSTLLTQIEACMNSRPLYPLTENVEDLDAITPGHFLTGGPMLTLPLNEPDSLNSIDIRNNWKLIELMRRHYWDRWSKEYLHLLQNRNKWQKPTNNIQRGQLVLIKENLLPPGKWAMGRVIELHPGSDNLVRVVTLKTQSGLLKRPITKLAPLPINEVSDCQLQKPKPENETKTKLKTRVKPIHKINSLLMVLLVVFTTLSYGRAEALQQFKITHLSENHPIYFDTIGNLQLIHDEWKLLVYYNLTTFWQSTAKVENFVTHLAQICATMPNQQCHSTVQQLKFEMNQLNEYNKLLLSQHQQRRRRGYVNGVGNIARTLFGVLDSDFAEKYAQDIQNIKTNEQYALQLTRNQTLIIETENSIIKRNEEFVQKQLQLMQQYINETKYNTEVLENRFQIMKTMNDVNAGALTASLLISVLRRNQQMLLDSLTDIYRGNLDMRLFTPQQLSEQLNIIAGIISKRLTLPTETNNGANIHNIYKLIYAKARLTEQYLLFELHIPLLSDDEYILYRIIPVTRNFEANQCQEIATTTRYIAVSYAKNTYIQIEEEDLQQCTTMTADNLICHAHMPIRSLHGPTASCEAKMLGQNVNITCDWIKQQCSDQWTKLQRPNIWLFNCIHECPIRIVCEDQITATVITKAGLLALGQNCVLQYNDTTIYSNNVYSSQTDIKLEGLNPPTIESPNDMLDTYKKINIHLPKLNLDEEHQLLDNEITKQKQAESLPTELSAHDIGHYAISSLLLAGIATAIILWRLRKCKRNENTSTSNRPRAENIELEQMDNIEDGYAKVDPLPKPDRRLGFRL